MKGINNQTCLGSCLPGDKISIHPVYIVPVQDQNYKPYCATLEWTDEKKNNNFMHDICKTENIISKINKKDHMLSFAIPSFGISYKDFLQKYYDLYSFESVSEWLHIENNRIYTKLRVLNCAWILFGTDKNIINDQIIKFYMDLVKKRWIKEIYPYIYNDIHVNKSNISFKKNKDAYGDHKVEKINFFLDKFNDRSTLYNLLQSYINTNKSRWANIEDHNDELKKYYIDYVSNKIKITLSKK
jgi:hypothetical protein